MSKKYLYGASVQGIQGFIFQTNMLREIAGASELVEQICTTEFAAAINKTTTALETDNNAIVTAAGNIKYVFEDENLIKNLVLNFPRQVMKLAPGVTLSQAVIEIDDAVSQKHIDDLEKNLKEQRGKPQKPLGYGVMGIMKSRRTGLPVTRTDTPKSRETEYLDEGQSLKRKASEKNNRIYTSVFGSLYEKQKQPFDLKNITKSRSDGYSWLAIVHADGNNMGAIIQEMARELNNSDRNFLEIFRNFSLLLDKATKEAAKEAYEEIEINDREKLEFYPFRPVVVGGDDLTVICRADLAIDFTNLFLEKFEAKTITFFKELKIKALDQGLTACAGIAYIKESYPFHYGYEMAETLCHYAKNEAKRKAVDQNRTPSCLMFHKVMGSYVDSFKEIIVRELSSGSIGFNFGPYYTSNNSLQPRVNDLLYKVAVLNTEEGKPVKSSLRDWLTRLHGNKEMAKQKMIRLISVADKNIIRKLGINSENLAFEDSKTPVFDWLTIVSINEGGN